MFVQDIMVMVLMIHIHNISPRYKDSDDNVMGAAVDENCVTSQPDKILDHT